MRFRKKQSWNFFGLNVTSFCEFFWVSREFWKGLPHEITKKNSKTGIEWTRLWWTTVRNYRSRRNLNNSWKLWQKLAKFIRYLDARNFKNFKKRPICCTKQSANPNFKIFKLPALKTWKSASFLTKWRHLVIPLTFKSFKCHRQKFTLHSI